MLLNGELHPITSEIGFLETDLATASKAYAGWMRPLQAERGVTLHERRVGGGLRRVLLSLLPLTSVERRRILFVPTAGAWVAYFDNGHRGPDAFPPMSYLAQQIGCRGLRVVATPGMFSSERPKDDTEGLGLDVYAPQPTDWLNYQRTLWIGNEGGPWKFEQGGTPFPFEKVERYKARRVRDRFDVRLLVDYAEQLGVRPFEEAFYLPSGQADATLFEKRGPTAPGLQEFSLEQAR